jgi:nucleoside-diphosphate-sugar epimerase
MSAETTPTVALVTGFPRLLARGLARRLLNHHPEAHVRMLVRPEDAAAAEALAASEPAADRLEILRGRLTDVDLGQAGPDIVRVLETTTHVFHAATEQTGSRLHLRRANVGKLLSLLMLAREMPRLQRFCFFSTAFVSGTRGGVIREEELDAGQRLRTPFEATMFEAEKVAREMMPRLPVTVLRPGSMIGHSRTGEAEDLSEGPNYLVRLLVSLPAEVPLLLPGSGVVPLNIVPIDYVVRAAVVLAHRPEAVGRTFHLTDPNPLSARQAFEILSDLVNRRPVPFTGGLPARLIRQVFRVPGVARVAPQQMALFENLNTHVVYNCAGTLELLAGSGVVCPPFESYADQLVSWVARYARAQQRRDEAPAARDN